MKTITERLGLLLIALTAAVTLSHAQEEAQDHFALIDMQYITSAMPRYKSAMQQIQEQSTKWQQAVESYTEEARTLYLEYQEKAKTASPEDLVKLENAIVKLEDEGAKAQQKYFGRDGELMKLQQKLLKPIQDQIYEAVKMISKKRNYQVVFDRASAVGSIIYANPKADISNDVLEVLGISVEKR